jgi:hypothetical protein
VASVAFSKKTSSGVSLDVFEKGTKQPQAIQAAVGDAYSVDIGRRLKLIVSPTCHMEQCIDIVQLNKRDVL